MTSLLLLLTAITASPATGPLPYYEEKDMTPVFSEAGQAHARVSAFKALDQNGKDVTEAALKNRITLVNFFYVQCPGICPAMMKSVQRLQKAVIKENPDVQLLSFSVMPEQDTPARLKAYSKTYGIDGGRWKLLTGDKSDIYRVGKEMFKADGAVGAQKSANSFIHTQNIYLVDQNLFIRGIYNTADAKDMANLAADLRRL